MFNKIFGRKKNKEVNVVERQGEKHTLVLHAKLDEDENTSIDLTLGEDMTNEEYVSMVSNVILYLSLNTVLRYNLNPEAYAELIKKDLLNSLANAQMTAKEGEPNE